MNDIFLLGASTPVGNTFKEIIRKNYPSLNLIINSKSNPRIKYVNLDNPSTYDLKIFKNQFIIVSFSPIWLVSKFFDFLDRNNETKLIKALIVCSSTSVITKRFSSCNYDKKLVANLVNSENNLIKICLKNNIKCKIIRPTLIYASPKSKYKDNNLSLIRNFLRFTPIILLPRNTGLRQPIHVIELARYIEFLIKNFIDEKFSHSASEIIEIGGDTELTYKEMIINIKNAYITNNIERFCLIISIPDNLFYFLISPINLINPKIFHAIMRINSNLSGFQSISKLLKIKPQEFPFKN